MNFDPDRYIPDQSGRFGFYLLRRWGQVDLISIAPGRSQQIARPAEDLQASLGVVGLNLAAAVDEHFLFQFALEDGDALLWPLSTMLTAWVVSLNVTCARSAALRAGRTDHRSGVHMDRLSRWVTETRALAEETRAVFGTSSELPDAMLDVANQAEQLQWWPDCRLKTPGPTHPQKRVDLLLNVELWALDQVFQTIHQELSLGKDSMTRKSWTARAFEPVTEVLEANNLPLVSSGAWEQRIWRVDQQIRENARDALMADVILKLRNEEITRSLEKASSA